MAKLEFLVDRRLACFNHEPIPPFGTAFYTGRAARPSARSGVVLPLLSAGAVAAGTVAALWTYATRVEPLWPRWEALDVPIRGLSPVFDGLTLLHVSDLHARRRNWRGWQLAEWARRFPVDVVCITGDFGDEPADADVAARLLEPLRGRLATLAVLGNHDYHAVSPVWPPRFTESAARGVASALAATGIRVLDNESVALERDGALLPFIGLGDPHTFHDSVDRAYRGVDTTQPSIALAHSWEPAPECDRRGTQFFIAGHTHGGQVCLPGRDAPVSNTHRRPDRVGGLFRTGSCWVHISQGIGQTHALRFFTRPGVTRITLRAVA
ncbi:MAG: hypothetical protein EPO26_11650 [Chloroflexota bacterium]|nr:MAG: hypothetical protein EPO26_11650 [Chloroflexota bacterium]